MKGKLNTDVKTGRYVRTANFAGTVFLTFLLAAGHLAAQPTLQSCAGIEDSDARLKCYDEAMNSGEKLPVFRLPRASATSPGTEEQQRNQPVQAEQKQGVQGDSFGLELKGAEAAAGDSRTMSVSAARHSDFTGWTIEFDNGQVWHQIGADDYDIVVGKSYTIKRASFNSFLLGSSENNSKMRVSRVE